MLKEEWDSVMGKLAHKPKVMVLGTFHMRNTPDIHHVEVNDLIEEHYIKKHHEMYLQVSRIGKGTEYVGIDWVRWWYQRNLIIYSNIAKLAQSSSDRILLIIGAGHAYILSQLLADSGLFEVIPVNKYLK
ncbi:hypothetical protein GCM10008986_18880 [Salinibacillus aidingensis]|uniref:TraB family protein n=1 Tax=Salinibacillus aidingensis TaxID=237684 RepID=A0ABN1B8Z1_9BACI